MVLVEFQFLKLSWVVSTMIWINELCFIIVGLSIYHSLSRQGIEQNNWDVMRWWYTVTSSNDILLHYFKSHNITTIENW